MKLVLQSKTMMLAGLLLLLVVTPRAAEAQEGYEQDPGAAAAAPPAPPPPDPKRVRALRLRFEQEPAVEECQKASLRFFKVHPDRVQSYRRGAAWKAVMPNVELIFNNDFGTNDRTLYDYIYRNKYPFPNGTCTSNECWPAKDEEKVKRAGISLGVRASWSLDRLIFNAEVLDVSSLVGVQEGLLREITSLYFTRRRLMTAMVLSPPQSPHEQITEQLRLGEITANIDALTGGYFSKEIKKRIGE
jgi:hypothetical protein